MNAIVYDTGVLVAAERSQRSVWAEHRVRLEAGVVPLVASVVLAQVSRSPKQVQLRSFLQGCEVVVLDEDAAHAVGALLGKAKTADVVDATVVRLAAARGADIQTGDVHDITHLVTVAGLRSRVLRVAR